MDKWTPISEGLPPPGIPLIVTVAQKHYESYEHGPKICYPVIYRKSFIRDEWGFYEHGVEDGIIGPDFYYVSAWMLLPKPYHEETHNDT